MTAGGVDGGERIGRGALDIAAEVELQRDRVTPRALDEVIWVMPGIWPNCSSSGVATDDAMVWGSAPGNCAVTEIVG